MAITIQDYEERISACKERLVKIDKRIKKWEDAKSEEKFAKDNEWMKDDVGWRIGWDGYKTLYGTFEDYKKIHYQEYLDNCDKEIRYANRDKEDTISLITKYENALEILKDKDAKPVIKIFKDFFNKWKLEIIIYVKPLIAEYYRINSERAELSNSTRYDQRNKEYDDRIASYELREKELRSDAMVNAALDKGLIHSDVAFNQFLDDYMNQRYFELVNKVTDIVGSISDVTKLNIGMDGTLNGYIYGDKGGAKIETIVAGGYNVQVRHYRILVHQIN